MIICGFIEFIILFYISHNLIVVHNYTHAVYGLIIFLVIEFLFAILYKSSSKKE